MIVCTPITSEGLVRNMIDKLGIRLVLGAAGDAHQATLAAEASA